MFRPARSTLAPLAAAVVTTLVLTTHVARAADTIYASNALLVGSTAGAFTAYEAPVVGLAACKEYTLRLNYDTASGTPAENLVGFQVWNNEGDAMLTSSPFGDRIAFGSPPRYYLQSVRRADNPSIEEVRFKTSCTDSTPDYLFRVFNYQNGAPLHYTLSLPGGEEL